MSNGSTQAIGKFLFMHIYEITQCAPLSERFVVAALLKISMDGFCFFWNNLKNLLKKALSEMLKKTVSMIVIARLYVEVFT